MSDALTDPPVFKRGARVRDRWWPWRGGIVARRVRQFLHVRWTDTGEVWIYDRAHQQFLEAAQ